MKNKICTARDKAGNLKRGEYTGYSEITKKHHVSFYDGGTKAFSDINAITFESSPVFETGATSAAVNELILYTDNTRELAEFREKMYCEWDEKGTPYGHEWTLADQMQKLLMQAIYSYQKQFPTEYKHICIFQSKKDADKAAEYCQIYANRFAEWKKEKERNSK